MLAALIAGGAAYFISKNMTPVFQAKTTILVNEGPANKTIDYSSLQLSSQIATTYSQMMVETPVLSEVARRLGLPKINPLDVTAIPATNTQLINVTVESTDPIMAAKISNTLVAVFSEQIQSLQASRFSTSKQSLLSQITTMEKQIQEANTQFVAATNQAEKDLLTIRITNYHLSYNSLVQSLEQVKLAEAQTTSSVVQTEAAVPPEIPIRPKVTQNVAIAAAVGLLLAAGLIYLIGMLDDTLKTPSEIMEKLGLPILGIIPHYKSKESIPITEVHPRSMVAESFRTLRTNLQFSGPGFVQPARTILFTSTVPGEGKTSVVVNLGIVLAQNNIKISLVDADLRRPEIHRYLKLENDNGLSQAFFHDYPEPGLNGTQQATHVKNLSVITSGKIPLNPSELLGSYKMCNILEELKSKSQLVLIDTPPALTVTDAAVLLPFVEGVVLVMKPGCTHLTPARQLVAQLRRAGANILGVVLNDVKQHRTHDSYYYMNN